MATELYNNAALKYLKWVYGCVLVVVFFGLVNSTFNEKVATLGDNAQYYILGTALSEGKGYTDLHLKGEPSHNHYPPGYPAIIASIQSLGFKGVLPVKRVNQVFFGLSLVLVFMLGTKLTNSYHLAFISTLFSLLNYHLLEFSSTMMSEIPFLFFSLLLVLLVVQSKWQNPWYRNLSFWSVLCLMILVLYIRTAGVALIIAVLARLFFGSKKKRLVVWLSAGLILAVIPWQIRSAQLGGNTYVNQLLLVNPYAPSEGALGFATFLERIATNFVRYLSQEIPSGLLNFLRIENYDQPISLWSWIAGISLFGLIVFGLIKSQHNVRSLLAIYLVLTFSLLLSWPPVWQGVRFMLPVVPVLLLCLVNGVFQLFIAVFKAFKLNANQQVVGIAFMLLCSLGAWSYGKMLIPLKELAKASESAAFQHYYKVAQWAKENVPEGSLVCTRKGELFYLQSGLPTVRYQFTENHQEQIDFLIEQGVEYLAVAYLGYSSTAEYLVPAIQAHPLKFEILYSLEDPNAYLVKFHPERGYTGEWLDNKKEGYGTFNFLDGRRFEGNWKKDKKEGAGAMYFEGGYYLKGVWYNDLLHGPAIVYNEENIRVDSIFFSTPLDPHLDDVR